MAQDNINPEALALLMGSCIIMLLGKRQSALGAMMITSLFIPLGQMFIIAGLHVRFVPILIFVGLTRIFLRGEFREFHPTMVDKLFIASSFASLICTCLRGARPETFGSFFDAVGAYLVFRSVTIEAEDVATVLRLLALVGLGMGSAMLYEHVTGRNPFFVFGGVPYFDEVREGRIRCQGSFRQPLMAGAFGATLLALMIALWHLGGRNRRRAVLGIVGSMVITVTAVSSGALMTFMAGIIGTLLWRFRERMNLFRRSIVVGIIMLELVMKVHFWYIIAKISNVFGGGGWHRSFLIDVFVRHFNEWWLIGTSYTAHWAPAGYVLDDNPNMMDITNHYIGQALLGGLLGLVLFVSMIVGCFKIIGRLVRDGGCGSLNDKCLWMLGVTLGAHSVAFLSVWYFDQITVYWTWLVASISSLAAIHAGLEANPSAAEDQTSSGQEKISLLEEETARS